MPRVTHNFSVTAMLKTEIARVEKNLEEKRREISALKRDHALQLQQAEDRFQVRTLLAVCKLGSSSQQKTCLSFEERLLRSSGQNGREGQVIESLKAKLASQRVRHPRGVATCLTHTAERVRAGARLRTGNDQHASRPLLAGPQEKRPKLIQRFLYRTGGAIFSSTAELNRKLRKFSGISARS